MKAAVLEQLDSPLSVREVQLTDLKVGQVLIKVLASGLCGAQLQEIRGHKGNARFLPHLVGHEGCGIVEKLGPGVTSVKKGDKVVMHWRIGAGIESAFPEYILDGKIIQSGKVTTLSEYSIASENRLTAVPQDTPDAFCALMGCSLTTAFGILNHEVNLKFGESVGVIGCGGVGLNLIQGAAMRSASPIVSIDSNETKKDKCLEMGADYFLHGSCEEWGESLKKVIPEGVDAIIDTTGQPQVLKQACHHLSKQGRLILVAQPPPGHSFEIPNAMALFEGTGKTVKATQGGQTDPSRDIPRYVKLHKSGKLKIDTLISREFSLDQINEALDLLRTGSAARIILRTTKQ